MNGVCREASVLAVVQATPASALPAGVAGNATSITINLIAAVARIHWPVAPKHSQKRPKKGKKESSTASNAFKNAGRALPHAHTHRDHAVAQLMALQCVDDRSGADGAGCTQRMA